MADNIEKQNAKSYWVSNLVAVLVILFFVLLFFGSYTGHLMQTDTYAKWFYSIEDYRVQYHTNARLSEWAYMEFFYRIMGEPQHFRCFHVAVGIAIDCGIIFILWKLVCHCCCLQTTALKILVLLLAITMRVNVFYSDIFQFGVDAAPMFLGDILAIISALAVTGIIIKRKRIAFAAGVLLLIASLMFRQTCLFWFVFTGLLVVFCESTETKSFLKRVAGLVMASIISVVPMLLLINFWSPEGSRGSFSKVDLAASWESFSATFLKLIKDCDGLQPRGFYTVILGAVLLVNICTVLLYAKKKGSSSGLSLLFREVIVTAGVLVGIFFPVVFELFLPHRTTCGFVAIAPLWILFTLRYRDVWSVSRAKLLCGAAVCILLLNLAVNYQYTHIIYEGLKETNRIDQSNARYYCDLISDYEKKTGTEVLKLAWHFDEQYMWALPGVIGTNNINNRAYSFPWSQREIFPFVTGRRFEIVPFSEELYEKHYSGKNWDGLNREQIMFIDDTVYIVVY